MQTSAGLMLIQEKGFMRKEENSLRRRVAISVTVFMLILTAIIAFIGYRLFEDNLKESYVTYSNTVLELAYRVIDQLSFGDMIAAREMPPEYEEVRTRLNVVKECSNIEYLYAIYFENPADIHSLHYAINAKTEKELAAGGTFSYMGREVIAGEYNDDTLKSLQQSVLDKNTEIVTVDGYADRYGHMMNASRVIFDSKGNAAGLLCVEIDINRMNQTLQQYLRTVIITAFIITILIIAFFFHSIQRSLIGPILEISESANSFVEKMRSNVPPKELVYKDVEINSSKEVNLLADNVKSLADGVSTYMTHLEAETSERKRMETEMELATSIQSDVLPSTFPAFPDRKEFDIYAVMDPAREVGGDFYDFFLIDETHLGLVIADVSGKGIPGALVMMTAKILTKDNGMKYSSPAEVLKAVNKQLQENNKEEMFVTMWFGILDTVTGKIVAANAGHEYPAVMQPGGEFELVKDKHGLVLGAMEDVSYTDYELILKPGSKLFVYTDGVPEATNRHGELFGTERMIAALNTDTEADPERLLQIMRRAIDNFVKDADQFDDLTMLCLEYKGEEEK